MATGDRWRVDGAHEDIWLVQRSPWGEVERLPRDAQVLTAEAAALRVGSWFSSRWGDDDRLLVEICAAVQGDFPSGGRPDEGSLRRVVRRALDDGRLVAVRIELPPPGGTFGEEAEPARTDVAPREDKTWLRIVLVDDSHPPKPVAFKRYRVELADGSVRQGMLDANGMAAFPGIDPGTCHVSFPDFHAPDWDRA